MAEEKEDVHCDELISDQEIADIYKVTGVSRSKVDPDRGQDYKRI